MKEYKVTKNGMSDMHYPNNVHFKFSRKCDLVVSTKSVSYICMRTRTTGVNDLDLSKRHVYSQTTPKKSFR